MHEINRILIIGAGNRVVNDVIPALGAIDFNLSKIMIVRKSRNQIDKYPMITIFNDLERVMEEFKPELIICCVPPNELSLILSSLIKFKFIHLLVDTPILPNLEKLSLISKTVSVKVLEDSKLIPWIDSLRSGVEGAYIVIVKHALYEFHGLALLNELFGDLKKFRLPKIVERYLIIFYSKPCRLIIWFRKRNYLDGSILFFLKTKVFKIGATSNTTLQWKYAEQFFQNSSMNTRKYLLLDKIDNNFADIRFIKDMLFWKRVGLMIGFKMLLINNSNIFVDLKEMIKIETALKK
jgi:hypothetical protein